MIKTCIKGIAGLSAVLLMSACATTLEADGRLDSARELLSQASAYGTSSEAYGSASGYLDEAETAFADGDADEYDASVSLTEAYARLAIAEGQYAEADGALSSMRSEYDTLGAQANSCAADLQACEANFSDFTSANLSSDLAILAAAMDCQRTGGSEGSVSLACQGVSFAFDSANLGPVTDARLGALAAFMSEYPDAGLEVIGHTDSTGPDGVNQALSEARARKVVDFLTSAGVDVSRLSMSGKGEAEPIADNNTRAGRAQNRRVDFVISSL
ncbi:MAG: OmpA family protein [Hyphomonadaceae bacterium]|nr:OmpA family protein [Hyphomonadaceae bacterium]